jgi:hypothetical protein
MMYKPLKSDPDQYDIECDVAELHSLYRTARDIQVWGRIVEHYAESCRRPHGFWDDEMAATGRITASLVSPFCDFFLTTINAHGDITVDRSREREKEEQEKQFQEQVKNGLRIVPSKNTARREA